MRFVTILGIGAVLLLMLVGLQPGLTAGEKEYQLQLLETPDGSWTHVFPNDVNDSERIVGYWDGGAGMDYEVHAILWDKASGSPKELAGLEDGDFGIATSINDRGEIGGASGDWWNTWNAVIWDKKGKPKDLHPSDDDTALWSEVHSVNQFGGAAGIVYADSPYGYGVAMPYVWPEDDSPGYLPFYSDDGFAGRAWSINKKGWVAGEEFVGWFEAHAIVWDPSGVPTCIHEDLVDAEPDIAFSRAWKVTDDGVVAGLAFNTLPGEELSTESWAWIWTEEDGVTFLDRGETDHAGVWQAGGKTFVGFINAPNFASTYMDAVAAVWLRGKEKGKTVFTLHTIETISGYEGMHATSANTSGRVVGVAFDSDGRYHAWFAKPK